MKEKRQKLKRKNNFSSFFLFFYLLLINNIIQKHPKGQPLNKINDRMFKSEAQWMSIANPSLNSKNNVLISNQSSNLGEETTSTNEERKVAVSSLIDTFTSANLDNANATTTQSAQTYKVTGEVGSFIAQNLTCKERIRVGHNGNEVQLLSQHLNKSKQESRKYNL